MHGARLSRDLVPNHYAVRTAPNLEKCTFQGTTSIVCDVMKETKMIVVNANHLSVTEASVFVGRLVVGEFIQDSVAEVEGFQVLENRELLTITMKETLSVGVVVRIVVQYSGVLNDRMQGFYRVDDLTRVGKFGAACHFEATGARAAFPCFDEPSFRAKFRISVDVDKSSEVDRLTILSNMPETKREEVAEGGGVTRVSFDETPAMPSYLVCWCVVYDYESVETKAPQTGTPVRLFVPKGSAAQTKFAAHIASNALDIYKEFFGVEYPLPKMDLISLADFAIGAMENWGLLTFRERFLIYDEAQSSANVRTDVAIIVAHEVAHQWFGNYVTLDWWTDLWLKEGYATWISYLCAEKLHPEDEPWTEFLTHEFRFGRELDSLQSSHPIEVEVKSPAQIDEIFDHISYNKGASIIRMLFNWIGEEAFRKGMNQYLKKYGYGNAKTAFLWEELEAASSLPVAQVMSSWTKQKGYPVLTVGFEGDSGVKVGQKRFLASGEEEDSKALWSVPLQISSQAKGLVVTKHHILSGPEEVIPFDLTDAGWVNLNPGSVGFYLVKYPKEMLDRFLPSIVDRSLPKNDRLNLLNDNLALAMSGLSPTVELLQLLEAFRNEDECCVWEAINDAVIKLWLFAQDDKDCLQVRNLS